MSDWLELRVEVDIAAVEAVSTILAEYGEGGVAIDQPVQSDSEGERYGLDTSRPSIVRSYVPDDGQAQERREAVEKALWHLRAFDLAPIGPLEVKVVREEEWAEAWKAHYHPLRIGRHVVIKPTWRDFDAQPDDVIVELDPGMAFGTGSHQTTAMCLEYLETFLQPGMSVLDQGCGSGILSIAAARLGASRVDAVDISSVAVTATQDNMVQNGLADVVRVAQVGDNDPAGFPGAEGPYDIVVANIIARVIVALAPSLAAQLKPGAPLIASGIIAERAVDVHLALTEAGLVLEDERRQDEWVALVARRPVA